MKAFLKAICCSKYLTWLLALLGPARTVILMYHDLREDDDFEDWMRVSASDFAIQLGRMKELGEIIGPNDLMVPAKGHRLRFLITFDDGYLNNFKLAIPILRRHDAPALFFVSTEHMQDQSPFWPDLVVTPIQVLGLDHLDLSAFKLGVFRFRPVGSPKRWDDIDKLLRKLKSVGNTSHPTVAAVLRHMRTEFKEVLDENLIRFRPLNREEVAQMSTDPLFHFGSHGHRHDILTYRNDVDVAASLQESRAILEQITGRPIVHLAYPNGDFNTRIIAQVKKAGYKFAHTNDPGVVGERTPLMAVPRLGIGGVGPGTVPFYQLNRLLLRQLIRDRWGSGQPTEGTG